MLAEDMEMMMKFSLFVDCFFDVSVCSANEACFGFIIVYGAIGLTKFDMCCVSMLDENL